MAQTNDEELIHGAKLHFADSAGTVLGEMANHSSCLCAAPEGSEHEVNCPIAVWRRAATTVRLLARED